MGLYRGGMSFSRFHVRGEVPDDYLERFPEAIQLRVFRELDPAEEIDQRAGWCAPDDAFDLQPHYDQLFVGDYLTVGMRVDTWRIPRSLFKAAMRDAERDALARSGEEKLSRAKKKDIEALLKARLRRKVIPAMRVFDLCWNLEAGVVRFFSSSPKMQELMFELFEKSFGLDLALDGVYLAAEADPELPATVTERLPTLDPLLLGSA